MKRLMQLGRTLTAVAGLAFSLAWLSVSARAADSTDGWARFRGPNGCGLVEARGLPATWAESDYRWKVDLPGAGHSAPVIWGARLFVTSGDEETGTRFVRCLNTADGATLWSREFTAEAHKKHKFNSFASSTPAVDARHVYISWATPEQLVVAALDHDGKEIWKRDLGPYPGGHGSGSSPIVFDDFVILANDKAGPSFIVALDAASGTDRWKLERRGSRASYSTPCVYQPAGQAPQLIFTEWEQGISGVDPKSGKLLWELDVFGEDEEKRSIGSPVIAGDLVIGTCGFAKGKKFVVAVKPTASAANRTATTAADKLAAVQEVYRLDKISPHIPTPLVKGNLLFLWSDAGIVTCADVVTGKTIWQQRVGGNFFGSPVCSGEHLYCVSDEGEVVVLAASENYELLGRVPLNDTCRSTPAIADGTLYLRTSSHLFALPAKK